MCVGVCKPEGPLQMTEVEHNSSGNKPFFELLGCDETEEAHTHTHTCSLFFV